jgi:hypothetical protein
MVSVMINETETKLEELNEEYSSFFHEDTV